MQSVPTGIDDSELLIPLYGPVCIFCVHLRASGLGRVCDAFPDGIPMAIWMGENDHRSAFPGDHGIQFESAGK